MPAAAAAVHSFWRPNGSSAGAGWRLRRWAGMRAAVSGRLLVLAACVRASGAYSSALAPPRPHARSVAMRAARRVYGMKSSSLDLPPVFPSHSPVPIGTPRFTKPGCGRNANTPGANPTYFDGLRLGILVSQLPRPLVSFNSPCRGCSPGCHAARRKKFRVLAG